MPRENQFKTHEEYLNWYKEYRGKNRERHREYRKKNREKHREKYREYNREWMKERRKLQREGRIKNCIVCKKEYIVRDIPNIKQQKYCSPECRKMAMKDVVKNSAVYKLRFEVLERDHFTCQYCGASPRKDPNVKLQLDHKMPNKLGGGFKKENLITACSVCNVGKGCKVFNSVLDL